MLKLTRWHEVVSTGLWDPGFMPDRLRMLCTFRVDDRHYAVIGCHHTPRGEGSRPVFQIIQLLSVTALGALEEIRPTHPTYSSIIEVVGKQIQLVDCIP